MAHCKLGRGVVSPLYLIARVIDFHGENREELKTPKVELTIGCIRSDRSLYLKCIINIFVSLKVSSESDQ